MSTINETTEHKIELVETSKDDQKFGVQMVQVTSCKKAFNWSMKIKGFVVAALPDGLLKTIKQYNNGLAYIENTNLSK